MLLSLNSGVKSNKCCSSCSSFQNFHQCVFGIKTGIVFQSRLVHIYLMTFLGFCVCKGFCLSFTLVTDISTNNSSDQYPCRKAVTLFLYLLVSRDMWRSSFRRVGLQVFPTQLGWLLNHFPISKGNCRQGSAEHMVLK